MGKTAIWKKAKILLKDNLDQIVNSPLYLKAALPKENSEKF